ncbi:recombinase family protein [Actinophytocola xinjiangensis]|uniref:recombinase family protein n=1 Tax=Actinophytocola xinjiangensis TaxID=485602 RepID=UPI002482EE5B|nr:recombinase family protein [Actinophytocola xinjiangensis]
MPEQNRHRLADGWQGSTVRAILDNPRYTGYAFFGRWTKHETLLDPEDVGAGHVVRFRRAGKDIAAGVDPAALLEVINAAQAEREAVRATLATVGRTDALTDAEVYAMIDSLGDVGATLKGRTPDGLIRLYESLRLQLRYEPQEQAVYVSASPRVVGERVRGRSCPPICRPSRPVARRTPNGTANASRHPSPRTASTAPEAQPAPT